MANISNLPVTIVGKVLGGSVSTNTYYTNASSLYNGYSYTYDVTLELVPVLNSDDRITPNAYTYDANHIQVGMWVGQPNGLMYQIIAINSVTSGSLIDVTIKDVDLFNLLSDTTFSGNNAPVEETFGIVFGISEDGDPILNGLELQRGNLSDINYWVNDFYARFQYRNLITTYYNNNPSNLVYSTGYTVGQLVYLDSTGQFQVVDDTNQSELEKAFGVITSVNEPEDGNMTVRPFGKITGGLSLAGLGNIGDVLYYDMTGTTTSYVTDVKPGSYPLPVYVKISDTTASFLGWPLVPGTGIGGGSGTSGISGTSGNSGTSGSSGVDGNDGSNSIRWYWNSSTIVSTTYFITTDGAGSVENNLKLINDIELDHYNSNAIYSISWLSEIASLVGIGLQVILQITELNNPSVSGIYYISSDMSTPSSAKYSLSAIVADGLLTAGKEYTISWVANASSSGSSGTSGESGTVTGLTLNSTILEIQNSDSTTVQVDFDPADDAQSKEGVTTHGFIFLDENSFTGDTFNVIFTASSNTDTIQVKELQVTGFTAKLTYVVLDVVNTGSTENYIVVLPPFVSANDESRVIKFVTKRNNLDNANDLMVASKWASGGTQDRIIAANINTKLANAGYFFPLETLESVELLYDGYDWLVVNTQKQQYVQATPVNYLMYGTNGTAGSFKNRDINNLL
jgi:hypothetical protein